MKRALLFALLLACGEGGSSPADAGADGFTPDSGGADAGGADATSDTGADGATLDPCFVRRSGGGLTWRGGAFAFVGANLRGIAYHSAGDMDAQLGAAANLGGRVVRIFAVRHDKTAQQVGDAIQSLIDRAKVVAPNVGFVLSLEDFYQTGFSAQGDDGSYQNGLLGADWFRTGYKTNYLPLVQALVTRFKDEHRVVAWEIGNELQAASAGDMLDFAYDVGTKIRSWGAQQLVTTGFIDVNHAIHGGVTNAIIAEMYVGPHGTYAASPFSLGSIHAYNNEQVPGNSFGYQLEDVDIAWFQQHAMPYMVGEGGFNGGGSVPCTVFGGGTWDSVTIPACGSDRGPAAKATTDIFFGSKAASGYLQWGLMVGQDNGEGDKCSGMDTAFHTDFSSLLAVYQARAGLLPAGGSVACP